MKTMKNVQGYADSNDSFAHKATKSERLYMKISDDEQRIDWYTRINRGVKIRYNIDTSSAESLHNEIY